MSANYLLVSKSRRATNRSDGETRCSAGLCSRYPRETPSQHGGSPAPTLTENGRLDLFMTNFYNEYNALFLQNERGPFQMLRDDIDPHRSKQNDTGIRNASCRLGSGRWFDAIIVNGTRGRLL